MTTRFAIDDDPSGGNLAATLAARVTATLALCLVVLETWLGAFATTEITVFYWSLTAFVGVLALWPTGSERRRALLVCSSWLMAGWGGLVVVGLRESLIVLSVAVPLVAGFFGVRAALSTLAASLVVALVAAWLHVDVPLARSESLSTERFSSTRHAEAWLLQVGVFAGLSCMAVLVLSATSSLARRETARARAFAAIAKRSTSALVVTDSMRRIVWVNEAFIRLTGFEVAEALGRRPADLLQGSGTSPEHVRRMRDALERGEDFVVETVNYRRDKAPYWVRLELQSLRDERGAIWGFTGAQQDVTTERVGTSLDRMERALLTDLSSARALDEIDEMLCRHLGTVENVAYVRVDWPRRDPSFDTDEPTTNAPTSTRLTVGGRENERVVLALGSGTLEVGVRPEMPGLAALLQRLESIAVVVSLSRRRVLDADELDRLFTQSPEGLLLLDPTLRVLRANVEARRQWRELEPGALLSDANPSIHRLVSQAVETRVPITGRVPTEGDAEVDLELRVAPIEHGGRRLVGLVDVTERVRTFEAVRVALDEKETLLREVHHRVKNNLQIVSGLLQMQLARTASSETAAPLRESVSRIQSMALVHQSIYQAEGVDRVELRSYAERLVGALRGAFAPSARTVVRGDAIATTMDVAVPFGLLLCELVTNALKYGYPSTLSERRTGEADVEIELVGTADDLAVSVADGGPGLSDTIEVSATRSLGMRLVRVLAEQIQAELTYDYDRGGRFTVTRRGPKL